MELEGALAAGALFLVAFSFIVVILPDHKFDAWSPQISHLVIALTQFTSINFRDVGCESEPLFSAACKYAECSAEDHV